MVDWRKITTIVRDAMPFEWKAFRKGDGVEVVHQSGSIAMITATRNNEDLGYLKSEIAEEFATKYGQRFTFIGKVIDKDEAREFIRITFDVPGVRKMTKAEKMESVE